MNDMKKYIKQLNIDMGFKKPKHITQAKKGYIVIFRGGFDRYGKP